MLDSSPVALPPVPRPLKRSSSTASLPTPPRTHHKRRTARSKAFSGESDGGDTADSGDQVVRLNKKRRISDIQEEEEEDFDDEDIFWAGGKSTKAAGSSSETKSASVIRRSESPVGSPLPLLFRKRERAQSTSSLVSPPPSFRKAKTAPAKGPLFLSASPSNTSPPRTPKNKAQCPIRDPSNNPFLDSPGGLDDASDNDDDTTSLSERPYEEKPTVTFVYRGVRKTFPNPYYDPVKKGPVSPTPNSLLPPEHIDFSPDLRCPPKVLFPKKKHRKSTKVGTSKASAVLSDVFADDSESEVSLEVQPTKLFADELKATERSKR
ncbi:uncharacterized protein BT62DRAFT_983693 [Guyanagaster necrorhizus]|uniref:Uncharacterized protein n=1 Tax=Guyanagaster necrorhizus TaxID=856835 RepID=A0A9P7W4Y8_9AGAR|nr:uncharacterized protein BT62DRAFT_983693 [Guyanagaster necrorhizus MCA 3950]KAG7452758.1 hypothetical protein BT62DRAFT_983693 [Guyanagaster necrorhizus MCA 3950]